MYASKKREKNFPEKKFPEDSLPEDKLPEDSLPTTRERVRERERERDRGAERVYCVCKHQVLIDSDKKTTFYTKMPITTKGLKWLIKQRHRNMNCKGEKQGIFMTRDRLD